MWDIIKKFLQKSHPACLLIEDGQPKYVVLSYEEYEKTCLTRLEKETDERKIVGEKNNLTAEKETRISADGNVVNPILTEEAPPLGEQIDKINQEISQIQSEIKSAEAASILDRGNEITVENLPVF